MPLTLRSLGAVLALLLAAPPAAAIDIHDTRLVHDPALSAEHIVFAYADDLWRADADGSDVRRLTSHIGREGAPQFSPDGRLIAFSAEYDGNLDVYVVGVEGGAPRRLTWHPGVDLVRGFTPDGRIVFSTFREQYTSRRARLFSVSPDGGQPRPEILPYGFDVAYSPDGSRIAYTPNREAFTQWKNYRGGTIGRIWIFDVDTHEVVEIPQPEGGANDDDPLWPGETIYFRSDRAGEFNLFSYDPASGEIEQLTFHDDFPVLAASATRERIVYEQGGYLHSLDLASGESERLVVGVAADLVETRPRFVDGKDFMRGGQISPSGVRAVFGMRGDIVTVPAEKGDARNLTATPGVHEFNPAWSPDGRSIAYFSDASGEVRLHVAARDGKGEPRVLDPGGAGFYADLTWSPDGEKLSYTDNSWSTFWLDLADGSVHEIATDTLYGPLRSLEHAWSPDSRWIAYTRNTPAGLRQIFVHSLADDRSYPITDGLSDADEPVFDAGGDYLYFFASTDAGPVRQWFSQASRDSALTGALYAVVLRSGVESPVAPQSDEETPPEEPQDEGIARPEDEKPKRKKGADDAEDEEGAKDDPKPVRIDFDGLESRIVALPLPPARYLGLASGKAKQLYFLRADYPQGFGGGGERSLRMYDFDAREEKTLLDAVDGYVLSANGEKILFAVGGDFWIAPAGAPIDRGKGKLAIERVEIRVEPRAEWAQMLDEAWRIQRDYFYDPGMHGADWPAVKAKYEAFLPHLATRRDLNRVIGWMGSELAVGHLYSGGGDFLYDPEEVPGGLLGADFETANGRYRFARIFGGLNWNPDLRSPLTEPGVEVKEGEYLLAVDGEPLVAGDNLYRPFENKAGKLVELEVGPNPDGSGSRTVRVQPIADEIGLRHRAWVEGNRERVDEATGGRVAYVHVPDTAGGGHEYFKRYAYPQADKQAIIVDERHNAGGQVADYVIDFLRRPLISYWTTRYGDPLTTPAASIQGPKVMLIDETAGSGGDLLPWMFRQLELGTLVGKRTWGGLVGILGFPPLIDGGFVTAPNIAFWTPEHGYAVENEGVAPDVEVEMHPKPLIEGRDPQLEKAIEIVLEQLEAAPRERPEPPPFPVRARR